MKKNIHHPNWNSLTREEIQSLFTDNFGEVNVKPPKKLVTDLRAMMSSTLECLENRTGSTVYRIWQTGIVYQTFKHEGMVEYDDYEEYKQAEAFDELLIAYDAKQPVYMA